MDWLHPSFVWAWAALPIVGAAYWWAARQRRAARERFGDAALVQRLAPAVRPWRRTLKATLVGGAVVALAVSLMGPRFGTQTKTVEREGVDLMVALDVSQSMQAEDVAPSRLRRAKKEIRSVLDELTGDRVGLVLFAGDGFVQCPLTNDYNAFRLFLDVAEPDQVSVPGTNFRAALDASLDAFSAARSPADSVAPPDERRARVLLVLSDGENHVGDLGEIKQQARNENITVFASGVGTEQGGRIPVYRNGRQIRVKRNPQGEVIRTRLDENALQRLAGDGAYFRIGRTSSALSDLPTALRQLETSVMAEETFEEYAEMYQWPLAVALGLLLLEVLIPVRTRERALGTESVKNRTAE